MANSIFKTALLPKPKRSTFDLSHSVKLTCNMGDLVPFMCEEVVPGDTWKNQSQVFLRFAPMLAPLLHKVDVYTHFFYVPWRIVWKEEDFEEFFAGDNQDSSSHPSLPTIMLLDKEHDINNFFAPGSLADYLGYPTHDRNLNGNNFKVSALPLMCYQKIYDEYYRDENLIDKVDCTKESGLRVTQEELRKLLTLRKRAWEKDYFTSALPWTQRGKTQMMPVADDLHLVSDAIDFAMHGSSIDSADAVSVFNPANYSPLKAVNGSTAIQTESGALDGPLSIDNSANLKLHDTKVQGESLFSINELRRASRIQKYLERAAVGGGRYVESLLAHFGIISDDLRIKRPLYLGGGKTPVEVTDVLQTSASDFGESSTPQGNPAGVGFSFGASNEFKHSFKERGYIIGIMSVMPKPCYGQGLRRNMRYFHPLDYYYPEFAELGEQEIFNYELGLSTGEKTGVFGYAPRYAEYKFIPDTFHGDFKTNLAYWHLGRFFENNPNLAKDFIECNPRNDVFAVTDTDQHHIMVNIVNKTMARRPMPYLPDPTLN